MINYHYKRINLLIILIFVLQLVSCQKNNKQTSDKIGESKDKMIDEPNDIWPTNRDSKGDYYYTTSLNSFPDYKTQNAGSHFVAGKETVGFLVMENSEIWPIVTGWGRSDDHFPIPEKLYVAYYALQEDKFYEGLFVMPSEKIKEELDKMWRAYPTKSQYTRSHFDRFKDLIVGVAPEGDIVVWLGSGSQTVEIGRYKAAVTDKINWSHFVRMNGMAPDNTKENYLRTTKREAIPIPIGKLEKLERRYNWKTMIERENENENLIVINPNKLRISYFNGELETLYSLFVEKNQYKLRAVPKKIIFEFYLGDKEFGGGFDLKEQDILTAFKEVSKSGSKSLEIVIQLDKLNEVSKIILRNEKNQYVIDPTGLEIGFIPIDRTLPKTPLKK